MPQNNIEGVYNIRDPFKGPLSRGLILQKISNIFPALYLAIASASASPLDGVNEIDMEISNSLQHHMPSAN